MSLPSKSPTKSALARQGSMRRLHGPRHYDVSGSPTKRTKTVKFDQTDEVIRYDILTPELADDPWNEPGMLESCESEHSEPEDLPPIQQREDEMPSWPVPDSQTRHRHGRPLPQVPQFHAHGEPVSHAPGLFTTLDPSAKPGRESSRELRREPMREVPREPIREPLPPQQSQSLDEAIEVASPALLQSPILADSPIVATEPVFGPKRGMPRDDSSILFDGMQRSRIPLDQRIDAVMDAAEKDRTSFKPGHRHGQSSQSSWGSQSSMIESLGYERMPSESPVPESHDPEAEDQAGISTLPSVTRKESLLDSQRTLATTHGPRFHQNRSQPTSAELERTYSKRRRQLLSMLDARQGQRQTPVPASIREEGENDMENGQVPMNPSYGMSPVRSLNSIASSSPRGVQIHGLEPADEFDFNEYDTTPLLDEQQSSGRFEDIPKPVSGPDHNTATQIDPKDQSAEPVDESSRRYTAPNSQNRDVQLTPRREMLGDLDLSGQDSLMALGSPGPNVTESELDFSQTTSSPSAVYGNGVESGRKPVAPEPIPEEPRKDSFAESGFGEVSSSSPHSSSIDHAGLQFDHSAPIGLAISTEHSQGTDTPQVPGGNVLAETSSTSSEPSQISENITQTVPDSPRLLENASLTDPEAHEREEQQLSMVTPQPIEVSQKPLDIPELPPNVSGDISGSLTVPPIPSNQTIESRTVPAELSVKPPNDEVSSTSGPDALGDRTEQVSASTSGPINNSEEAFNFEAEPTPKEPPSPVSPREDEEWGPHLDSDLSDVQEEAQNAEPTQIYAQETPVLPSLANTPLTITSPKVTPVLDTGNVWAPHCIAPQQYPSLNKPREATETRETTQTPKVASTGRLPWPVTEDFDAPSSNEPVKPVTESEDVSNSSGVDALDISEDREAQPVQGVPETQWVPTHRQQDSGQESGPDSTQESWQISEQGSEQDAMKVPSGKAAESHSDESNQFDLKSVNPSLETSRDVSGPEVHESQYTHHSHEPRGVQESQESNYSTQDSGSHVHSFEAPTLDSEHSVRGPIDLSGPVRELPPAPLGSIEIPSVSETSWEHQFDYSGADDTDRTIDRSMDRSMSIPAELLDAIRASETLGPVDEPIPSAPTREYSEPDLQGINPLGAAGSSSLDTFASRTPSTNSSLSRSEAVSSGEASESESMNSETDSYSNSSLDSNSEVDTIRSSATYRYTPTPEPEAVESTVEPSVERSVEPSVESSVEHSLDPSAESEYDPQTQRTEPTTEEVEDYDLANATGLLGIEDVPEVNANHRISAVSGTTSLHTARTSLTSLADLEVGESLTELSSDLERVLSQNGYGDRGSYTLRDSGSLVVASSPHRRRPEAVHRLTDNVPARPPAGPRPQPVFQQIKPPQTEMPTLWPQKPLDLPKNEPTKRQPEPKTEKSLNEDPHKPPKPVQTRNDDPKNRTIHHGVPIPTGSGAESREDTIEKDTKHTVEPPKTSSGLSNWTPSGIPSGIPNGIPNGIPKVSSVQSSDAGIGTQGSFPKSASQWSAPSVRTDRSAASESTAIDTMGRSAIQVPRVRPRDVPAIPEEPVSLRPAKRGDAAPSKLLGSHSPPSPVAKDEKEPNRMVQVPDQASGQAHERALNQTPANTIHALTPAQQHWIAKHRSMPEPSDEIGRLYVRLQSVNDIQIPGIDIKNSSFVVTLDNGTHCITTPSKRFGSPVGEEYTFSVDPKSREVVVGLLRASSDAPSPEPVQETRSLGADGSFGRFELDVAKLQDSARGRVHHESVWCENEWSQRAGGCRIAFDVMWVPRLSPNERLPTTLADASAEIAAAEPITTLSGELIQFGGGNSNGRRRWFILDAPGGVMVAHSARSHRPRAIINLAKAVSVVSSEPTAFIVRFRRGEQLRFTASSADCVRWVRALKPVLGAKKSRKPFLNALLYDTRQS